MKNWKENLFSKEVAFCYAVYFQLLLFLTYSIAFFGLVAGKNVSPVYFPLAILISCFIFFFLLKKEVGIISSVAHILFANILLAAAFFICIHFFDTSYDGQWYHQPAIIRIAEGWNPVHQPFYPVTVYDQNNYTWIQHYPKASWIMGACIYKTTGLIESAKLINFMVIAAVFFYSYSFLSVLFKNKFFLVSILSLLICFNPVAISQLLSDYVDAIMAGMLCIVLLSLFAIQLFSNNRYFKWKWFLFLSSIIIVANVKFTGLYIAAIIIAIFSIYWWKRISTGIILRRYAIIATACILAIALYGYNPYFTNWHYKGYVFYPLNVKEKYDILLAREPDIVKEKNNVSKFIISICSEASNNPHLKQIPWKNPFTVSQHDLRLFEETDVKLGGFGPLFLSALLLSLLTVIFFFGKMTADQRLLFGISLIAIFLSVILAPAAWRTRYMPQFYFVPMIIIVFSFYFIKDEKKIIKKSLPIVTLLMFLLNILLIARSNIGGNLLRTGLIKQEMQLLKLRKDPLLLNFSKTIFQSPRIRLKENNISFIDADTLHTNVQELRVMYNLNGEGPVYNKMK